MNALAILAFIVAPLSLVALGTLAVWLHMRAAPAERELPMAPPSEGGESEVMKKIEMAAEELNATISTFKRHAEAERTTR